MMPEYDTITIKYEKKYKQLEAEGLSIQNELEKLQNEYLANVDTYSDTRKSMMQQDIQRLSARLDEFPQMAQMELQKYVEELQRPIIKKIQKAIEKVAKANNYSHIIDSSNGTLLFSSDTFDIMELVKAELGIEEETPSEEEIKSFEIQE
jgi:outer membrane protein